MCYFDSLFYQVGHGKHNENSRLIRFTATNCSTGLDVYAVNKKTGVDDENEDDEDDDKEVEVGADGRSTGSDEVEIFLGKVLPSPADGGESYNVFPSRVGQLFKLVTSSSSSSAKSEKKSRKEQQKKEEKKRFGMYYLLEDSTAGLSGNKESKARLKIPLDTFAVTCPN